MCLLFCINGVWVQGAEEKCEEEWNKEKFEFFIKRHCRGQIKDDEMSETCDT